jgi:Domain of unknown function (DUF4389)
MAAPTSDRHPLRLHGELESPLSRWLWLVKWLLLIPHLLVLLFLWLAFAGVTVAAFVVVLLSGRYPRGLFDFNVGVLRWTWRVAYYGYGALGSDRYPPFTLGEVPDYPATLKLDYPSELSRSLVLVKWWLLALPHYLLLGAVAGGGRVMAGQGGRSGEVAGVGVLTLVVLFAGVSLLFRERYPQGLFDLALGLDRWGFRVLVYVALMTDVYPPFRLDQDGAEPGPGDAPAMFET